MAFFKFRSAGQQGNETRGAGSASAPAESVESMRRRARHRLLGAAVLVLVGVVGFPLLFDTQPRPVSGDIPIDIPDRAKSKPLAVPAAPAAGAKPEAAAKPESSAAPDGKVITERADGSELVAQAPAAVAPKPEPKPEVKPEPKVEPKPEPKVEHKPEPKPEQKAERPEPKPAAKPATSDDGARARALLDGSGAQPVAAEGGRFVVQVGAFADAGKAREVRQKLEKAGLKTYTNVAKTNDGERTRVRVGPFASRADADKAAGKVKELSLPAAVLTL